MNKLHTWKSLRLTTLLCSIFMISLQLTADKANAQFVAHYTATNGTGTTVTPGTHVSVITNLTPIGLGTNGACASGGLSGLTNNGVTTFNTGNGHVYFVVKGDNCYKLNVTSFTCKLRKSGSGITKVRMAYSLNGGTTWVNDNVDKTPDNSGCGVSATTWSWNVGGGGALPTVPVGGTLTIALYPYAPGASGGVIQFNDINVGGAAALDTTLSCHGTPSHATISADQTVCVGTTVNPLTASGASTLCGISYQWQSDASGSYSNISTATNSTYGPSAPATAGSVHYRMITICNNTGDRDTSNVVTITANPNPFASAITPANSVICVQDSITLNDSTEAGMFNVWSVVSGGTFSDAFSSPTVFKPSTTGTIQVTFTSTNLATGCLTVRTVNVNVVYCAGPCNKDLALYHGTGGNSTSVITVPNVTASTIAAHGSFGTTTPCASGGISGLDNFVAGSFSTSNPYVSYVVTPTVGSHKVVNAYQYWVKSRSSGSGPTKGRLAYRYNSGAGFGNWIPESADHTLSTSGSCGANTNVWSWTPDSAVNGAIAIEIGFWPFAGSAGGTLQVNELEIAGCVGDSIACTSPTHATVTPSITHICGSGFYQTTSFTGAEGLLGLSYQWQASSTGAPGSFSNVGVGDSIGENNVYYTSKVQSSAMYYRIVTSCGSTGDTSNVDTLAIIAHPGPISISGLSAAGYVAMGDSVAVSNGTLGGIWEATHFSVADFSDSNANPAELLGLLKGFTPFHYFFLGTIGCTVFDSVKVAAPNSLTAYTGKFGTSTTVENPFGTTGFTFSGLTTAGTGFNAPGTPCSEGGLSGLTINTTVATYSTSGPRVCYTVIPNAGFALDLTGFDATTRSSAHGPAQLTLAYSLDGGLNWVDNGVATAENTFGCGISTVDQQFIFGSDVIVHDSIIVCVFPYAADNNGGTFQLNALDVEGSVICDSPTAIQITDGGGGHNLDGSSYAPTCTLFGNFPLTVTPVGGTWSVVGGTGALTVTPTGPGTADLTLDDTSTGIKVVIVRYTTASPCSITTTASVTVDDADANPCDGTRPAAPAVPADQVAGSVAIYPNPTSNLLNIVAGEKVNVTVLSMDGRTLIHQDNASQINVNKLADGVYMIQVYNQQNTLIKTTKFTKE